MPGQDGRPDGKIQNLPQQDVVGVLYIRTKRLNFKSFVTQPKNGICRSAIRDCTCYESTASSSKGFANIPC
jgi:hypothetical protein